MLSAEYETVFRGGNHGFRPKRSGSTAMDQALAYANDGYVWVVDVDLAQFFETVNHGKLLQVLSKRVKDRRVIKLVHKMLRASVSENGVVEKREFGTPQGGPVLANILLHKLDVELEARGHKYVRYADDLMVLCRSWKAAERTLARLKPFIEEQLFLQINVEKTKICHITAPELKFLGFGFWAKARKGNKPLICDRPHQVLGEAIHAFAPRNAVLFERGVDPVAELDSDALIPFVLAHQQLLIQLSRRHHLDVPHVRQERDHK